MRNTFLFLPLLLLSLYGCEDDINCVEMAGHPDCLPSCLEDPTLPGCDAFDLGMRDMTVPEDAGPCGECGSGTVCDVASGSCVACLVDGDCGDDVCLVDDGDSANNECVGCVDSEDCSGALGVCDEESNECVGCLMDADCTEADASACNTETNMCEGCSSDAQCTRLTDTPVCDEAGEMCVECTADDESACGDNVCDISAGTCTTDTPAGMTGLCQECVSDRQCQDGQVCAPMTYDDTDVGSYCLWRESSGEALGPDGSCAPSFRPYVAPSEVTSVSGETVRVCGLSVTTCAALNDYRVDGSCSMAGMNDPCGAPGIDDGLCRDDPMSGPLGTRCSIPCLSDDDCPGLTCLTSAPRFCDF